MLNVYDSAHQLAQAIKESGEYKEFKDLRTKLDENPQVSKMIEDFEQKQFELQMKQLSGENPSEETMKSIQDLYQIIAMDPIAGQYMQSEIRFSMMMKDVYDIIGEAVGPTGTPETK